MSTCIHLNMWNSCFAAKEQPNSKQWPKFSHALWPSPLYWLHFIFTWDIALLQWLFMPNYLYICHISVLYRTMSISAQMHKALFIQTNSLQKIQLGSHQAPIGMIKSSWDAIISVGWKFIPVGSRWVLSQWLCMKF